MNTWYGKINILTKRENDNKWPKNRCRPRGLAIFYANRQIFGHALQPGLWPKNAAIRQASITAQLPGMRRVARTSAMDSNN